MIDSQTGQVLKPLRRWQDQEVALGLRILILNRVWIGFWSKERSKDLGSVSPIGSNVMADFEP